MSVFEKILKILKEKGITFDLKEHEEARTSEEAAAARGEDIKIGAKAMVIKADNHFVMCVLSAHLKIDSRKLERLLGAKELRFATHEEVEKLTGCKPGGVPPFGPFFGLSMVHDKSLLENKEMAFNAGERTRSIKMKTDDYFKIMPPAIHHFSKLHE